MISENQFDKMKQKSCVLYRCFLVILITNLYVCTVFKNTIHAFKCSFDSPKKNFQNSPKLLQEGII